MMQDDTSPDSPTTIAVCIVTYRRPASLDGLLDALQAVAVPGGCAVRIVVIDNDPQGSALEVARKRAASGEGGPAVHYVLEERRGVSAARTRAVDEALALGADFVAFLDDDEIPTRRWLERLHARAEETGADLVGGPMACRRPEAALGLRQSFLMSGLAHHTCQKVWKDRLKARRGGLPTIVTNNWFARASFLRDSGMRFDERYGLCGGEDTDFFFRFLEAGGEGAWCHEALVLEEPTPDRLSLRYQFCRSREKSLVHFIQKKERGEARPEKVVRAIAVLRIVIGAALAGILFPVPWAVVAGTRSLGWGFGRLDALRGASSAFFADAR